MTLTPMQQKRQATLVNTLYRAVEQRDLVLARLVRHEVRLKQLRQQLARLSRISATTNWHQPPADTPPYQNGIALPSQSIDDPIPAFLDRRSECGDRKDAEARAAIEQEKAERDRAKAIGRKARAKAKASGDTKKMPLTGAAALAHIRSAG